MPVTAKPPLTTPITPPAPMSPLARALANPTGVNAAGVQTAQPTTLQGTASQAGLAANMSTPATAASLGASSDASKMAGTPNALAGALGLGGGAPTSAPTGGAAAANAIAPASLSAGERTNAYAPKEGADDAARTQKQQQLAQEFGSVGIRVEGLVEAAVQAAKPAASAALYSVNGTALDQALGASDPTAAAAAKQAVTNLAADPGNQTKFIAAQNALKAAGVDAADPLGAYATASDAAQQAAAGLEHQMFLDPATMQKIGLTAQDLTDIGIDPTKAGTTTIAQLRDAIAAKQATGGPVTQEAAAAASGFAGVGATRALQRDVAGAQSQAGYSAEAAAQQSLAQAQRGETINIGGTDYKIEDLLNSDNFTQLAKSYLQAAPDSALRKQLDSQMPSLSAYIQQNQTALTAAIGKVSAATAGVKSAEAANTALVQDLATKLGMSADDVRKTFGDSVPGLGDEFTSTKADPSKNAVLAAALDPSMWPAGTSPIQLAATAKDLQKSDPAAYAAIEGMTPGQLAATGILGRTDAEKAQFAQLKQQAADASAHLNDTPEQKLQFLFGTSNPSEASANLLATAALTADPAQRKKLQDMAAQVGKPGQTVNTGDVSSLMPNRSLTDLLKAAAQGSPASTGPAGAGYTMPVAGSVAAAVSSALAMGGNTRLTANPAIADKVADTSDSVELEKAIPQLSGGDPAVASALQNAVNKKRVTYTGEQAVETAGLAGLDNRDPRAPLADFLTKGSPERMATVVTSPDTAAAAQSAISALQRVATDPHAYPDNANWKIGILKQQLDAFNRQSAAGAAPTQPKQKTKLEKLLGR